MQARSTLTPLLLGLLVAAALAGCTSNTTRPGATDGTEPGATTPQLLPFSPEAYLPESDRFAEPGIKIAPDGTIYVTAPGARNVTPVPGAPVRGDTVWRSDDKGKTFVKLPIPDPVFGGGDSDLAVASDGTVYQSGLWLGCVSLSVSTNKGQSWVTNPLACGYAAGADDRNWLASLGSETVYLTFGWAPDASGTTDGRITLIKTLAKSNPAAITTATMEDNYQWPGNIAVDQKSGTVYVTYNTVDDEIVVLKSTDGGMTMTKSVVAKRPGDTFDSFTVVAVDKSGGVYVTWSERNEPDGKKPHHTDIFYAYSTDAAAHWSAPILVNSKIGTHIFPWLDAAAPGHLAIVWYGSDTTGDTAEKINGTWQVYIAESGTANTPTPAFVEGIASTSPIARGSICTSGTMCKAGTRDLLDYFQVALDAKEVPHLVWATKAPGAVKLAFAKQLTG